MQRKFAHPIDFLALMKVLFWLLHPDPRSRATIRDLKKDKWTNQPLDDSLMNFDCVFGKSMLFVFSIEILIRKWVWF